MGKGKGRKEKGRGCRRKGMEEEEEDHLLERKFILMRMYSVIDV